MFHDEERRALVMADVVQRADIRVGQLCNRVRLAVEPLAHDRACAFTIDDDLDRDCAVEPGVAGAIDLAHPAGAERRFDLVRPEASSPAEFHGGFDGA